MEIDLNNNNNNNQTSVVVIPKYLEIKLSKNDSLILSPQLISHFPFLKFKNDLMTKFNDRVPEILLHLSNEYYYDKNRIISEPDPYPFPETSKIVKHIEKFNSFREYLVDIINSRPLESQYIYSNYGSHVRIRSIGKVNTSSEREELSFFGGTLQEMFEKAAYGGWCLDKYGNKVKYYPPDIVNDYLREYVVHK